MLPASLARGVRAARTEGVGLGGATFGHIAVDLIGADQKEHLVAELTCRLTQHRGAADVGLDKRKWIHQRTVDVSLRGKVHDRVRLRRKRVDDVLVADVAVDEAVASLSFELDEVCKVARIRELVEHRDLDVRARAPDMAHEIRSDETRSPGDKEPLQVAGHLIGGQAVQS